MYRSSRIETYSLNGLAAGKEEALYAIKETDPALHDAILSVIEQTASNSSVTDLGGHTLYVGRKTGEVVFS